MLAFLARADVTTIKNLTALRILIKQHAKRLSQCPIGLRRRRADTLEHAQKTRLAPSEEDFFHSLRRRLS